jgi:hypothetical protein
MHVLMLAHAVAREFRDPNQPDSWKRWDMRLHNKTAEEISGWADAVLFGTHEALVKKEGMRTRGVSTGERLLHTEWTAAYSAKNRYGLEPIIPLDWAGFWAAAEPALRAAEPPPPPAPTEAELAECGRLVSALDDLLPQLEGDPLIKARTAYRDMPRDQVGKLRSLHKRVIEVLEQQSAERRAREEQLRADAAAARAARESAPTTSPEADVSAA